MKTGIGKAAVVAAACVMSWAMAGGEGWQTDWQAARAAAARDGRVILMDFTGSDWCPWCVKLDKEVFSQEAFRTYAAANLVLMEVDFPRRKELPAELKDQNKTLQEQFGVTGFPTIFLVDAQGLPFGRTGYRAGGAEAYVAHLKELTEVRTQRDENLQKAAGAEGLERARFLARALEGIPTDLFQFYADTVQEIRKLDPENQTGFRARLTEAELGRLEAEVRSLCRGGKQTEAIAKVDAFIAAENLSGELKQKALMAKLNACPPQTAEGLAAADALMDEVIAVDAQTATARQCTAIKARIVELKKRLEPKPAEGKADAPAAPAQ